MGPASRLSLGRMRPVNAPRSHDPLLNAFLGTPSDDAARRELGVLLDENAAPLLWKIFRRQLGRRRTGFDEAELEDLHAATLLKLQIQLAGARRGEREPPASFLDYVATTGFNAVAGLLLASQPVRTRLRDRVRYVLRREDAVAAWSGTGRDALCGLAAARGEAPVAIEARELAAIVRTVLARTGSGWGEFPRLVRGVLDRLEGPCRLEDLVDALFQALGLVEVVTVSTTAAADPAGSRPPAQAEPVEPELSTLDRMALAEAVRTLWREIVELPENQRIALLVNLRGSGGESLVDVLLASRVVDHAGLAAALRLSPAELHDLLPQLPRDDLWIAERLGLTRQQVINLRKSARLRLARHLRGHLPGLG